MPERTAAEKLSISRGMHEAFNKRRRALAHPFVEAVLADPRFGSITAWAEWHDVPLSTVASWYSTNPRSKKTIPRLYADLIASEFLDKESGESLVPATTETWRNGIL